MAPLCPNVSLGMAAALGILRALFREDLAMRTTTILMLSLLALAASWRLLPHPDNMTPVMAVALFAGLWLKQPLLRIAAPVGVMLVSDLLLGFHDTMVLVYIALLVP